MSDQLPAVMTAKECASALRCSVRSVRRYIQAGRLRVVCKPPGKPGRVLILKEDVVRLLTPVE